MFIIVITVMSMVGDSGSVVASATEPARTTTSMQPTKQPTKQPTTLPMHPHDEPTDEPIDEPIASPSPGSILTKCDLFAKCVGPDSGVSNWAC